MKKNTNILLLDIASSISVIMRTKHHFMSARKLITAAVCSLILFFGINFEIAYADTSVYRSAGWVETDSFSNPYSTTGCQISNDGKYCSRPGAIGGVSIYFGSFGDLDDFGIPLNSTIDKLHIRIRGKSSGSHLITIAEGYNKINYSFVCQKPSDSIIFFLGPTDNIVDKHLAITSANGLSSCITQNNIDFRNLTFVISRYISSIWSADIDNFEIAFDFTPPAVPPSPVVFPEGQKGTVWEIGPDKSELRQIQGLENVISVATGEHFKIALKSDGTVWTWVNDDAPIQMKGENGAGFLTDVKKISAGTNGGMALKNDGKVWVWTHVRGQIVPQNPMPVGLSDIIDIVAGSLHKLALKNDGTLYGWGINNDGQIGIGCLLGTCGTVISPTKVKNITNVKAIAAGWEHSLAIKEDGTVWGWGSQSLGQLGEGLQDASGNYIDRTLPVQLNGLSNIQAVSSKVNYNLALDNEGKIIEWGGEFQRRLPKLIPGIDGVSNISAGWITFSPGVIGHFIKDDKTLWQVYINDISPKQVPILKDVVSVSSGHDTASLAVVNSTGEVLGDSTEFKPFLDLPWDYGVGNFDKQVFNPSAWFDHEFPLQNIFCCTQKVRTYDGIEKIAPYRSHAGYDYASKNGVELYTPVVAAADGIAEHKSASHSGGLGDMIKIDHKNGYQTWYGHLDPVDLIVGNEGIKKEVKKGDVIGKTGFTGNIIPQNKFGAHIHFGVFKDANGNGNFDDDYPLGLVDPLGWEGDSKDPWTDYKIENSSGSASIKLFTNLTKPKQQSIPRTGGEVSYKNVNVKFDPDTLPLDFTIHVKDGPYEYVSDGGKKLSSILPSFFLEAFNSLGDKITQFLKPIVITYDYSGADLTNTKEETLRMHYYDIQEEKWIPVDSVVDLEKKIIIAEIAHFTQFAVMGEVKDALAPMTHIILSGTKGQEKWYRSSVSLQLTPEDNEGGEGIKETLYSVNDNNWQTYAGAFALEEEGEYEVSVQSSDIVDNIEEIKTDDFKIDKTAPITTADSSGTEGQDGWFTSDVEVKLSATDSLSGVSKTEYSLDGGESYQQYLEEFTLSNEGESGVLYRSVDKSGNIEETNVLSIKIDKTLPSSLVYTSGLRGEDNWYRSDVEIALNGDDNVSGYKTSFYSLDGGENYSEYFDSIIFSAEGEHEIFYYSVDVAGNNEDKESIEIKIDKTLPKVSINAAPSVLWPPNGKIIHVRITGDTSENNLFETNFKVSDEYGLLQPVLARFGSIIKLQAMRRDGDLDGRVYMIEVLITDLAGNNANAETKVTVPHDMGN